MSPRPLSPPATRRRRQTGRNQQRWWGRGGLWLLAATVWMATARAEFVVSRSGQFLVRSAHPTAPSLGQVALPDDSGRVVLQAPALAVSCERIKSALLAELGLPDQWQGNIQVDLRPARGEQKLPRLTVRRYADGWRYFVVTPDELPPREFVRTMVSVLLLEMANRFPGPYPATVPYWLSEGLTAAVSARIGPGLVPSGTRMLAKLGNAFGEIAPDVRNQVYGDALSGARTRLRERAPLSFEDLSLPAPGALVGDQGKLYQASALAFLTKLRQLPGGDVRLKQMLSHLTRNLNWQTTFLQAYQPLFGSLLEVEKWWALAQVQFLGEGPVENWSPLRALRALEQVLRVTVETRTEAGVNPVRRTVLLQAAGQSLGLADFLDVVRLKQRQLALIAARLPREVGALGREYRSLLERYLAAVTELTAETGGRLTPSRAQAGLQRELFRLLERLDRKRGKLAQRLQRKAEASGAATR